MNKFNQSIWKNSDKDRCFLLADDLVLPAGDYLIQTSTGREQRVQKEQLAQYEVTQDEATQWLKKELTGVIGQFRKNLDKQSADRKDSYPDQLAKLYKERTQGGTENDLADVLEKLSDNSQAIPDRMKTRMREIATRLKNDKSGEEE